MNLVFRDTQSYLSNNQVAPQVLGNALARKFHPDLADDGARKVAQILGEIASASQEQAQWIDQLNKGVVQVDKVVQRNVGSAEEYASASRELSTQAEHLRGIVTNLTHFVEGTRGEKGR